MARYIEFCVFVTSWRHALRSEWPFIIIIIIMMMMMSITNTVIPYHHNMMYVTAS